MAGEVLSFPVDRRVREGPQLPHSAAAEQAVCASAMQDATAATKVCELLRRDHFYDVQLGWIFFAILRLRAAAAPVGRVTVEAWLHENGALDAAGGEKRVRALGDEFPEPSHVEAHAAIIVDMHERRELALTCRRVEREVCAPVAEWEPTKAKARKELGRATAPRATLTTRPIGAGMAEAREELRAAHLGTVSGVRYPLARVEALVGLLVSGEQTIVSGYSEHGKTPFSTQVAVEVAARAVEPGAMGEAVYFVSGEMPRAKLLMRVACTFAGLDVSRARLGGLQALESERLTETMTWLDTLAIEVDDQPATPDVLAKRVREAKEAFAAGTMRTHAGELLGPRRLWLVIGDHLQTLAERDAGREERQRLATCAQRWLDEIAKAQGVATMLLCQLRAPNEAERKASPAFPPWPTADMLFGAPGQIKAGADTVIAVHRPEKFLTGKTRKRWQGVGMICALKRRFSGERDRVALRFDRGMFVDDLAPHDREFFEGEGA